MPVFDLNPDELYFPPAHFAGEDGFLARGGRVDARWLEYGYLNGYYVWHNPMRYPDWYSPDPRLALETEQCRLEPEEGDEILFFEEPLPFLKFMQKQVNQEPMNNFWISGMLVNAYVDLHKQDKALFMVFNDKNGKPFGYAFGATLGLAYFGEYILSNDQHKRVVANMIKLFKEYDILLADFHKPSNHFNPEWCQPMDRIRYLELLKQYTDEQF